MEILRKYGVQTTIIFPLIGRDSNDLKTSATLASGDFKIIKDEGASANTTNLATDEGNGLYAIVLTATEMQAARIAVICADQTAAKNWEDTVILIATYGNASAQHEFDLDSATVTLADDGITAAKIATDAIDADALADGAITAATFAAGAIDATAIAANAIGASELAADAVAEIADAVWDEGQSGHTTAGTFGKYLDTEVSGVGGGTPPTAAAIADAVWDEATAGHTTGGTFGAQAKTVIDAIQTDTDAIEVDTQDIQSRLPAALVSGRIDASVGAVAANAITAASIATDAIDADALAADAVTEIAAGISIPSATTIADAVLSRPISDVEGSAAFRTLAGAIAKLVNRVRVNGSSFEVYKTDDTTLMGTQTATTDTNAEPISELNTD